MNKESLINNLSVRGIQCSANQADELEALMKTTLKTNELFNLTAITNEDEFMEKMIFDSALAVHDIDLSNKSIIDVGTGAGFPGLVVYLMNKETKITLLDSTKKKIDYIASMGKENGWTIGTINDRVENVARTKAESFDYAIARAVSSLPVLLETIIPLLKVGGTFLAMKGKGAEEEIEMSKKAFAKLNCHLDYIHQDVLPECGEMRYILYIKKDGHTPKKYPRDYADIKKKPL